jgi:hypothetical protein
MTETEITFIQEQIKLSKHLNSLPDKDHIDTLCDMAGCTDKERKTHSTQFLKRRWNPHPSERFKRWWVNRGILAAEEATGRGWQGIDYVRAYNCEAVRDVYRSFLSDQRAEMQELPF